uniref:Integrase catalytic domain-containing protein n=1 Tax=Tanacetum cinerariifolium TaxID=118510 RepID=A0A6L2PBT4_TANCI|nr:hypothetical protein [Tanacetum cinerariifolium]
MADENVLALAPARSDDQILPFAAWVPIGKSNFVLDLHKKQKNPIFQIFVDILHNSNFFRAFTASASVPAIYIQQFWNTLTYEAKTEIMPIDQAHQFVSPPSGDAIMDFVNQLGYTEIIHFVSRIAVNNLYQPWRAVLSMINYPTKKGRKDKPHVILYYRFTKLIICHLGRIHNIHQRSTSLFNLAKEDLRLGNLKFVPKGEVNEVSRMPIPSELILNNIKNAPYYKAYLEMVTKHDRKVTTKKEGKKKTTSAKTPKSKPAIEKSSKPTLASKPNATKERPSKASTAKPPKPKPAKRKVNQDHTTTKSRQGQAHVNGVAIREPVAEATRPLLMVEGKGKAIATKEQVAHSLLALHTPKRRSTTDQFVLQRRTSATEEASTGPSAQAQDDTSINIVCDSPSLTGAKTKTGVASEKTNSGGDTKILQFDEEQGNDVDDQVNLKEKTDKLDQGQARSDPDLGKRCEALAGPDPEPMHDDFMADLYPKVQESLKFPADEHVALEEPLSSCGTLSSIKNLDDAYTIGDEIINEKSTEYEPAPIFTATTTTTTTNLPLPPPPPQQSTPDSKLVARVTTLEQKLAAFENKIKTLKNTTQNLGSRVFTLELRDLPHKIDDAVCESVKEAVYIALQAPLKDRFREVPKADTKEILHQRMFENGFYKSLPEHVALYEALEASMERAQRDEFLAEKDKSHKRSRPSSSSSSRLESQDMRIFMHWYCQQMGKTELTQADFKGKSYEVVKAFYPDAVHLQVQMEECHKMLIDQIDWANLEGDQVRIDISKPLPLSGLPGHVTIQTQFFFNHDLDYLRYGSKGRRRALSISKMKAARYLDFGLELLVPQHMWINEVCTYDISASYGVSH